MKKILFIALSVFFFLGCSSSDRKTQIFSNNRIIFGYEGGVANMATEYTLQYDGVVVKYNNLTDETVVVTKIPPQKSEQFFHSFLKYGLDTLSYARPGNMSRFVGFKNDSVIHKIIWGYNSRPPSKAMKIYNELIQIVKNQ